MEDISCCSKMTHVEHCHPYFRVKLIFGVVAHSRCKDVILEVVQ